MLGVVVCTYTLIEFSYLNLNAGYWDFFWPQLFMGLSLGFLFVPLTTVTMGSIPRETMGNATSLFNLVRNLGGSIGISSVETMQFRATQNHISVLGAHVNALTPAARDMMNQMQGGYMAAGSDPVTANHQAYSSMWGMVVRQAAMMSYNDTFRVLGFLFLILIPLVFILKKPKGGGPIAAH